MSRRTATRREPDQRRSAVLDLVKLDLVWPAASADVPRDELVRAQIEWIESRTGVRVLCTVAAVVGMVGSAHAYLGVFVLTLWGAATVAFSIGLAVQRQRALARPNGLQRLMRDEVVGRLISCAMLGVLGVVLRDAPIQVHFGIVAAWTLIGMTPPFSLMAMPRVMLASIGIMSVAHALYAFIFGLPIVGLMALCGGLAFVYAGLSDAREFFARLQHRTALQEKEETVSLLLREFEDAGADWLWQCDAGRALVHVSPRFAHALGRQPEELEGVSVLQVLAGDSWKGGDFSSSLRELSEKLKRRESFANLRLAVTIGGERRWWDISASPRVDDGGNFLGFRGVGSDATEQKESNEKIAKLARYDTLTGLPNRLMINEALAHALDGAVSHHTRPGFMMIDLDRFKAVNDSLGHPVGDRLLVRVAERLRQITKSGEMAGRLGGDEFAVVMNDASDLGRVSVLADAIISTLSRPYEVDQNTLYIGASVGTAVSPRDGRTAEMLIRSADLALYKSKEAGGGTAHAYQPKLHAAADERRTMELALRKALERGEFHLVYQPVVSATDPIIEGFETLLRWTNPDLGSVSPVKFIPLAEEARLIGPIGEWVLRSACIQACEWPDHVRVAVNVSTDQLNDPNFVQTVVSALSHSGLDPKRLELEVTESLFLKDGGSAVQMLDRLLGLGLRLALDDFGTGYSSLGYLQKARFSTIKVDRSFVQGAAAGSAESVAIIRAVVAMAESLGMATTAEGVETEAELALVQRFGCSKVQGYLYGRPMPAGDTFKLLESSQRRLSA